MASEPLPPLPGSPTFEPGCDEITTPPLSLLPPAPRGGASAEPASPGPPRPVPLRPAPEPNGDDPPPIDGGGGITLSARSVPLPDPPDVPEPDGEP